VVVSSLKLYPKQDLYLSIDEEGQKTIRSRGVRVRELLRAEGSGLLSLVEERKKRSKINLK
jgi:hypothetical protein